MTFKRLLLFKREITPPEKLVDAALVMEDGFSIHVWVDRANRRDLIKGFKPEERFVDIDD